MVKIYAFSPSQSLFYINSEHRLFKDIDWDIVQDGNYAIVDPTAPRAIMYLPPMQYQALVKVSLSTEKGITLLATPNEKPGNNFDSSTPLPSTPPLQSEDPLSVTFVSETELRKKGFRITNNLIQTTDSNVGELVLLWGKQLHSWTRTGQTSKSRKRNEEDLIIMGQFMAKQLKHQSCSTLIQILKISQIAVQKHLAGTPLKSTQELGIRVSLSHGIPSWIPARSRAFIRQKNIGRIRVILSITNMYKAIDDLHPAPSYDSIDLTPPLPPKARINWKQFVPKFWEFVGTTIGHRVPKPDLIVHNWPLTLQAGANANCSFRSAPFDVIAWYNRPRRLPLEWARLTGDKDFITVFNNTAHEALTYQSSDMGLDIERATRIQFLCLGRLSLKYEAAGKVRVFAILDYWRQRLLKPLHDWLFSILEKLPGDSTFDQDGSLREIAGTSDVAWSLDISKATDTISIDLGVDLLRPFLGDKLVKLWKEMMVSVPFKVPNRDITGRLNCGDSILYSCGGPMGAYSSWGVLDLIHHCMVQFASFRAHGTFTDKYRVLGDDSTILSASIAKEYLKLAEELSIPINIHKSYCSEVGLINFANQTYLSYHNISPVSLKEELAVRSIHSRFSMACRLLERGWGQSCGVIGSLRAMVQAKVQNKLPWLFLLLCTISEQDQYRALSSRTSSNWSLGMFDKIRLALGPYRDLGLGWSEPLFAKFLRSLRPNRSLFRTDYLPPKESYLVPVGSVQDSSTREVLILFLDSLMENVVRDKDLIEKKLRGMFVRISRHVYKSNIGGTRFAFNVAQIPGRSLLHIAPSNLKDADYTSSDPEDESSGYSHIARIRGIPRTVAMVKHYRNLDIDGNFTKCLPKTPFEFQSGHSSDAFIVDIDNTLAGEPRPWVWMYRRFISAYIPIISAAAKSPIPRMERIPSVDDLRNFYPQKPYSGNKRIIQFDDSSQFNAHTLSSFFYAMDIGVLAAFQGDFTPKGYYPFLAQCSLTRSLILDGSGLDLVVQNLGLAFSMAQEMPKPGHFINPWEIDNEKARSLRNPEESSVDKSSRRFIKEQRQIDAVMLREETGLYSTSLPKHLSYIEEGTGRRTRDRWRKR